MLLCPCAYAAIPAFPCKCNHSKIFSVEWVTFLGGLTYSPAGAESFKVTGVSALKSLGSLLVALLAAALAIALCLAPIVGLGGATLARTDETMQSNLSDLTHGRVPGVTTVTDASGEPMAWIFKQRRYEVPSEAISQYAKDALVSTEDRRFFQHEGVDMQGFARAMVTNVLAGGVEQGASTINQQYVKNYLWLVDAETEEEANAATEQSIPRKLREMRMASDLDKTLEKDEILTRYLNLVSFGNHAFGIEAAALTYFGIPARELDPAQAALLVGILQSVEGLNPYTNPEGAMQRRNTVLANMAAEGYLEQAEADRMAGTPLGILDAPNTLPEGCITAGDKGFMCDYALRYLADKGLDLETIQSGSYTITTTLDPAVQEVANNAVRNNVSPYTPGVAEVMNIIRPGADSRDILAMASSRFYGLDLDQSQTILPQPASLVGAGAGSVFKIFTAAAALEQGYGLDSMLDTPERSVVYGMGDGGAANCPTGAYCVENAGSYAPRMTLQDALAQSPNTTFVELIQKTGVAPVVDTAVRLGLRSYTDEQSFGDGRSIAQAAKDENMGAFTLGPLPVNALELSNVGATLASDGRWCEPNPIKEVLDEHGQQVFIDRPACEQAVSSDVAATLSRGMSEDITDGTAAASARNNGWSAPAAAKTGTTESHQSTAFLGFTRGMAAAPYIYNDGTQSTPLCTAPVRQCGSGNLFGGNEAADTWFQAAAGVPGAADGGLPVAEPASERDAAPAAIDSVVGQYSSAAKSQLEAQGYTVSLQTVDGGGAPAGTVVSVARDGAAVTLNVSGGAASSTPSRPVSPPSTSTAPPAGLDDLERSLNEARDAIADVFGDF